MNAAWRSGWPLLVLAVVVTALAYRAGLHGGYIYDDYSFVVNNRLLDVASGRFGDWVAAAMSFPSGAQQGRWLTMLSFAMNQTWSGPLPYGFKLTNLCIHLANGALLFLALRALFALYDDVRGTRTRAGLAAAAIAALWLVLPINLTAVLYVSQRLESLSNLFVLLGLWWYLRARRRHWRGEVQAAWLWIAIGTCTTLGVMAKESAVLLPLYTACIEFVLTRWRVRAGSRSRAVVALYGALLLVPLVLGLAWLASWVDGSRSYGRAFDIPERLMTECRVLVDYIRWSLAPSLDQLTLYHDDIAVSRGLLDPPSTLACLLGLAALFALALWQRHARPLLALGLLWFFAGHLLTGTVIPLMLAFEHRNYFPSIGLLLAAAALIGIESRLLQPRALRVAWLAVLAFYAATTALRANEWSDPDRLTLSEAAKRPQSPSAQFALGHLMVTKLRRPDGSRMREDGFLVLENGMRLPGAGVTFEQSLITFHAEDRAPIRREWWDSLVAKLKARPPSASDARALANLNHCYIDHYCGDDITPLKDAFAAAMSHGSAPPVLLSVHAEYAWYLLHDREQSERDMREAVRRAPLDPAARSNLAVLLLSTGRFDETREELAALRRINHFGMLDRTIAAIQDALDRKESGAQ